MSTTDLWAMIDETGEACVVDSETLFHCVTDWASWMSFMRMLLHNRPALMLAQPDQGTPQRFKVIPARDLKPSSSFDNPLGRQ
jgi:hypothetical protein